MEESTTLAKIAIAVIILVVIIGVVFGIIVFGQNTADSANERLATQVGQMENSEFDTFDNTDIAGSKVLDALTRFKGQPVGIIVKTKADTAGTNYLAKLSAAATPAELNADWDTTDYVTDFAKTKNSASPQFIKKTAKFHCVLIKNANEEIVGILADQNVTP